MEINLDWNQVFLYFVDCREGYHNVMISLTETNSHLEGYEKLLFQKIKMKEMILDKNGNPYQPISFTNFDITNDLVMLGHFIFLNDSTLEKDHSLEIIMPQNPSQKISDDINAILPYLKGFTLDGWMVKEDGTPVFLEDVQLCQKILSGLHLSNQVLFPLEDFMGNHSIDDSKPHIL